jgi:hypothetical protein
MNTSRFEGCRIEIPVSRRPRWRTIGENWRMRTQPDQASVLGRVRTSGVIPKHL